MLTDGVIDGMWSCQIPRAPGLLGCARCTLASLAVVPSERHRLRFTVTGPLLRLSWDLQATPIAPGIPL